MVEATEAGAKSGRRLRILMISRHFLDLTSEGLCAVRTASLLQSAGHRVTVIAGVQQRDARGGTPSGFEALEILRVGAAHSRLVATWTRFNDRAGRSMGHRLVSASLNLWAGANAREYAWLVPASALATDQLKEAARSEDPFDVVFSRLNPVTSHLAALRTFAGLGSVTRRPPALATLGWTAYFSDPWPHFLYPPPYHSAGGPLHRRRALSQLRQIGRAASSFIFPSPYLARHMLPSLGCSPDDARAHVVPHLGSELGSEPASEARSAGSTAEVQRGSRLRFRHAGFLMKERRIGPLFEALLRIPDGIRRDLLFEFVGRNHGDPVPPRELAESFSFAEMIPPDEAFRWVAAGDIALLVEADVALGIFMPSKLADYAAAGLPMLALSPERGVVADYLCSGGGLRASPADVGEIAAAVVALHRRWRDGSLSRLTPDAVQRQQFGARAVLPLLEAALYASIGLGGGVGSVTERS